MNCVISSVTSAARSIWAKCPVPGRITIRPDGTWAPTRSSQGEAIPGARLTRSWAPFIVVLWMASSGTRTESSAAAALLASHLAVSTRSARPAVPGRRSARSTMRWARAGSLVGTNIDSKNRRTNGRYRSPASKFDIAASAAAESPLPILLPSTRTSPAAISGAIRLASRTNRHPMLWPTRMAGGRPRLLRARTISAPRASTVKSAPDPSSALWPGRSQVTTVVRVPKDEVCALQSVGSQANPWTKTIGGPPVPVIVVRTSDLLVVQVHRWWSRSTGP